MSNLFITADTHFGHENCICYDNRPFKNLEHMDSELIRRWNARVKPFDQIIIAGDFMFHNSALYSLDRGMFLVVSRVGVADKYHQAFLILQNIFVGVSSLRNFNLHVIFSDIIILFIWIFW